MAEKKQSDPGIITTGQAAKLLGVSEAWIGKLHKMEYVPKAGRGKWNLVAVVQGYIRFLKDDARRSSKSAAQSRMTDIKSDRLEMQYRAEMHELVERDDALFVLDYAASLIRSSMMAVPARFTRDLEQRARLEAVIGKALNDTAKKMEKKATALAKGEDVIEE